MASRRRQKRDKRPRVADPTSVERIQTQPSVRVSTAWTPSRVQAVQASADSGNMQQVADLIDQILVDDRYGPALSSLVDSVLGAELSWEAGLRPAKRKLGEPKKEVPLANELEEDWWERYSEAEYAQILKWREMLGFCWGRITWFQSLKSQRLVPLITFWHPRHFRYDKDSRQWWVKVNDYGGEEAITAGEGEWALFVRCGLSRPWADGRWRGVSRWWMLKACAISDWGVHSEKAARAVVTADEGTTAADRKALAADLYALAKDGVISLPHGFEYQLVEATANTRDIYDAQIEAANKAGTIAILGQNLTTDVSDNGSRAAGEVHERKEQRNVRFVAEAFSTQLREQIVLTWARYNFGDTAVPPWHVWQVEPPEDVNEEATVLSTLGDALGKLQNVGLGMELNVINDRFGTSLIEVERPEPEPAPGGGKPPGRGGTRALHAGARQTRPFVSGQIYSDDVADATQAHATDELELFVNKLLAAIGNANDYDSIRAAVHSAYADEAAPTRLAELVEHAVVMAHLGGRLSVHEDTE